MTPIRMPIEFAVWALSNIVLIINFRLAFVLETFAFPYTYSISLLALQRGHHLSRKGFGEPTQPSVVWLYQCRPSSQTETNHFKSGNWDWEKRVASITERFLWVVDVQWNGTEFRSPLVSPLFLGRRCT